MCDISRMCVSYESNFSPVGSNATEEGLCPFCTFLYFREEKVHVVWVS